MNEIFNNLLSVPMHQLSARKANRRTRLSQIKIKTNENDKKILTIAPFLTSFFYRYILTNFRLSYDLFAKKRNQFNRKEKFK